MKKKLNIVVSALLLSVMLVGATSASAAGTPGPCGKKPCHVPFSSQLF
ncbi:MAG: hypothetical protein RR588_09950 [Solibacillus sp.]